MRREIRGQVVVITGASSGIGREAALEFGQRGAHVVAAARNKEALDTLAAEIDRLGGSCVPVVTDVSDPGQVMALAAHAAESHGRIDTWVNNASVATYGTVAQMEPDEVRRVIEVDLLGQVYGMMAALPHLRASNGTLINVSSVLAKRAIALQAAYCAAKHGIVAFGESLRLELQAEGSPVRVVDVLPASINTPLFENARSKLGVRPRPVGRVYEPRVAAEAIVSAARCPVREVYAGFSGRLADLGQRISPALLDVLLRRSALSSQRTDQPDNAEDNLFTPSRGTGRTTGRFGQHSKSISLYTRMFATRPAAGRALLAAGLGAAVLLLRRSGRRG